VPPSSPSSKEPRVPHAACHSAFGVCLFLLTRHSPLVTALIIPRLPEREEQVKTQSANVKGEPPRRAGFGHPIVLPVLGQLVFS
jgi:hypothetical protein